VYLSLHFSYSGTGNHVASRSVDGLQSQGAGDHRIIKTSYFLKIIVEQMTSNIIYKVDALMYVSLRKAKKHMPYGELVANECVTL
jgi:hypothetical protein